MPDGWAGRAGRGFMIIEVKGYQILAPRSQNFGSRVEI
jgi:hypothetical protein